ncbi:MAG: hypothetical protein CBARDCOR_0273 [uncultured Caballeronia sp.]|nr:MAG: hypothetical protein CBARDCOR_0273 [uncultured Caballeronia sp.]
MSAARHLFFCAAMPLALGLATSGNARAQSADAAQSSSSGTPAESADTAKTLPAVKVQGTADVLPGDRAPPTAAVRLQAALASACWANRR